MTSTFIKDYVALIAITNPLSALAIFTSLTGDYSKKLIQSTALTTFFAISVILIVMTWIGLPLLHVFGIKTSEFAIAGGIIIAIIGYTMLQGETSKTNHSPEEQQASIQRESIAIIPLSIPMIAGPGAMVQAVMISNATPSVLGKLQLTGICLCVALTIYVTLRFSNAIHSLLGVSGLKTLTRIMGLIIMSIAITMVIHGLEDVFPGWIHT